MHDNISFSQVNCKKSQLQKKQEQLLDRNTSTA